MTSSEIVGYVVVPLVIFLLTTAVSGVIGIVKLTSYFAGSREAQESTAQSNKQIVEKIDGYMARTDVRLNGHDTRITLLEYVTGNHKESR